MEKTTWSNAYMRIFKKLEYHGKVNSVSIIKFIMLIFHHIKNHHTQHEIVQVFIVTVWIIAAMKIYIYM